MTPILSYSIKNENNGITNFYDTRNMKFLSVTVLTQKTKGIKGGRLNEREYGRILRESGNKDEESTANHIYKHR